MKASTYNIFFPYEDKIIGYNSISDNFIILEKIIYDLYKASIHENKIKELPKYHETLYNSLLSNGFIVEENRDELKLIKKISYQTDFNEENFELIINPTMNCNFKCWYCYETHIKKSKMSEETVSNIIKYVENILEAKKGKLKNFKLDWFGGEPLLYFNSTITPLLKSIFPKMKENNIYFSSGFTTNGLLINQNILDICKKYNVNLFQITLDGHRDRHNQVRFISKTKGSYDEIVNNIKLCLKNNIFVSVRINISEETIKDLLKIIDDFKDISEIGRKYMEFSFHEVWQEEKNLTVDISQIVDIYRGNGFVCSYKGERSVSIKNSCYADKLNQAVINYNGEVFKCTARDFKSESKEGDLNDKGEIIWNTKYQKRIYDLRFSNKPCLECKILPICNGGCSQHKLEQEGKDYCIFNYDESTKLEIIKQKFYSRLHSAIA
ncbi:radical SAM/SPASM domain-containing protein [Riemerella anatipestifer]|uniref:radical SAM/SPASM domain-containing protein n=1 Tax=Riemerella anatipestifer TaxID=34085 RepID=UPI002A84DC0E|nr:radical SAM protein [Riemerella anatipestifer]MDY3520401.1 radical SAM protein [Riemerella anatipestifer]MDY3533374.1 radical SAM protein [Riemerella anatipestifer]MDY3534359.1 radical SAM protein [Riemerella anatipestifer]